jgi:hypothetical protein
MSLDFNVSDIKDYKAVTTAPQQLNGQDQWHPVTEALVWSSIPCGYNRITEKNLNEVWGRVEVWQRLMGGLLRGPEGDIYMTKEDVRMHIGLSTNASEKTRTAFYETLIKNANDSRFQAAGKSAMQKLGWKGQAPDAS